MSSSYRIGMVMWPIKVCRHKLMVGDLHCSSFYYLKHVLFLKLFCSRLKHGEKMRDQVTG